MTLYISPSIPLDEILKLDSAPIDGLLGAVDSLGYKIQEIEYHVHNWESWFGKDSQPDGEVHVASRIGPGVTSFQLDAGNNTWGAWVQLLGSNDTPARVGNTKYDFHRLDVEATEVNDTYFIQVGFGASGAAALLADTCTDGVFHANSNQVDAGPVDITVKRLPVGTKVWARCMAPLQNTATINFYFGIHEYPG